MRNKQSPLERPSKRKPFRLDPERLSDVHEVQAASRLGHRRTAASGASPLSKSDSVGGLDRCEMKATSKKSLSVKLAWLEKITEEAISTGRYPILQIRFENAQLADKDWVLVDLPQYRDMREAWEKTRGSQTG